MKVLEIEPKLCTRCYSCEVYCSLNSLNVVKPSKSQVQVAESGKHTFIPIICRHCEEPRCKEACPANAIRFEKCESMRRVKIDEEKCDGCNICVKACPIDAIQIDENGEPMKCDLCNGDPECVKFCETGAIKITDAEQASSITDREGILKCLGEE
ncbi:hypothetical protein AKJ38_03605 [candidate division MSBL1 archaeon SCGC-AAA259I14]|uniref:4Fe-4S ferredoxin-type domain-containing protein n=1 Tax=candidate division MSBL1 archaeon SCGC-AAA259I14 TaxID=1698268 RepID=A0A133UPX3_9EURY|nr:hypothetical protein AKJ38_03605 [candidate division MSBL1 archaeon SCGC-AAA259I14]